MKPSQKLPFTALLQGRHPQLVDEETEVHHPQLADEETEVRDGDVMNSKSYNMEVMERSEERRVGKECRL